MSEWYAPNHVIPTRQPKVGELLFEFHVERTHNDAVAVANRVPTALRRYFLIRSI